MSYTVGTTGTEWIQVAFTIAEPSGIAPQEPSDSVTIADSIDNTAVFTRSLSDSVTIADSIDTGDPIFTLNTLDVYQSSSTTIGSGTLICSDVDLTSADSCIGVLERGFWWRC